MAAPEVIFQKQARRGGAVIAEGDWGKRDARGEWRPDELPKPSPIFRRPWKLFDVLKYLFAPEGFFSPYNLLYALLAVVSWLYFTPSLARTARFEVGWIAEIYLRNVVLVILVAGGLHLRLFVTSGQGTKFKYNEPVAGPARLQVPVREPGVGQRLLEPGQWMPDLDGV